MREEWGFLRARECAASLGVYLSTWWAWVASGKAPKGVMLGPNTRRWQVKDVRELAETMAKGDAA